MITEEQVTAALAEHAQEDQYGQYSFGGPSHSPLSARQIVRACLILGMPVSDVLTGAVWLALVAKVATIEERLAALEERS